MSEKTLLVASGDFSLLIDSAEKPAQDTAYDDATTLIDGIKKVVISNKAEEKEHFGASKGIVSLDEVSFFKHQLGYKLTSEKFDARMVRSLFFASQGTDSGTAPAAYETFTPLSTPQGLRGFARLRLWDRKNQVNPRFIHQDFECLVKVSNDPEINPEDYTSLELEVRVIGAVGTIKHLKPVQS